MKEVNADKELEKILRRTKNLMDKAYEEENTNEFVKLSKSFAELAIKKKKFEVELKQMQKEQDLEDPLSYFERL